MLKSGSSTEGRYWKITVTSNLTLLQYGENVIQIGCDQKRIPPLLLGGEPLRRRNPLRGTPGLSCAGRGVCDF